MTDRTPLVLITRPRDASERFGQSLTRKRQVETLIAPVIGIEPVGEPADTTGYDGVIFTSAQAVPRTNARPGLIAYCVGAATASAARNARFIAQSADGAADELVHLIKAEQPIGKLLHVRGADTVGDVAARLDKAGVPTDEVVVYRQVDLPISPTDRAVIADAPEIIAPVFSARSARRLAAELGVRSGLRIVAISPAAAKPWKDDAAEVITADAPTIKAMLDAVLRALDSDSHCRA